MSVKKRDRAFLKKQLESLWNFTSSDAQQIFFWPSENNTARDKWLFAKIIQIHNIIEWHIEFT